MANVAFDAWVSNYYRNKIESCKRRGIEFDLSLMAVHNILKAKYCYYTGIKLTRPPYKDNGYIPETYVQKNTDVTIERLDNKLGYIPKNVVACSKYANGLKGVFEDPSNAYELEHFIRMVKKLEKIK